MSVLGRLGTPLILSVSHVVKPKAAMLVGRLVVKKPEWLKKWASGTELEK